MHTKGRRWRGVARSESCRIYTLDTLYHGYDQELCSIAHYFSDKIFWIRFIKKIVQPRPNYMIEEIDLREVFGEVE